jgi:hypothetical protein
VSQTALQTNLTTTTNIVVFNNSAIEQTLTLTVTASALTLPLFESVDLSHSLTILSFSQGTSSAPPGTLPPAEVGAVARIADASSSASTASLGSTIAPFAGFNGVTFTRTHLNFTLEQIFTIRLGAGQSVQFDDRVLVEPTDGSDPLTPVPAPAGIVLLATAIPVLGLRRVLRRKLA